MAAGRRRRPRRVGRWFGGGSSGVGSGLYRSTGGWYGVACAGGLIAGLAVVGLLVVWLWV